MEDSTTDLKKLKSTIEKVLVGNHSNLKESVSGALDDFCSRMFQEGMVTATVRDNANFNQIMKDYKAKMLFMKSLTEFRKHCLSLIIVLQAVGGPAISAAGVLEREWTQKATEEMNLRFNIVPTPHQQSNDPETNVSHTQLSHFYASHHPFSIPSHMKQVHTNPPLVPNSSTKIWQYMKHDRDFRNKILERINENVVTNKGQSSETLSKIWEHQVEKRRQKVPLSPALDDYPYGMDYQESNDRKRSVWLMPRKNQSSPVGHNTQRVPVDSRDQSMHWFTDPCFMDQSDDHLLIPENSEMPFYDQQQSHDMHNNDDTTPLFTTSSNPLFNTQVPEAHSMSSIEEEVGESVPLKNLEGNTMLRERMIHSLRNENEELKQRMSKIESQVTLLIERTRQNNYQSFENGFADETDIAKTHANHLDELKQKDIQIASLQARLNEKQAQVNEHRVICLLVVLIVIIACSFYFPNTHSRATSQPHPSEK